MKQKAMINIKQGEGKETCAGTTPQHRNSNGQTVVISRYTDGQSVGKNFYRQTTPVGASPVGKSFYRRTLLIPMDHPLE